jgi:hypothetical protein
VARIVILRRQFLVGNAPAQHQSGNAASDKNPFHYFYSSHAAIERGALAPELL